MDLFGKNVVLTGAASGIGAELLKRLCQESANIVAADLNKVELDFKHPNSWTFEADLSQKQEVDNLFDFAREKMGHIDVFIANAGFAYYEKIQGACLEFSSRQVPGCKRERFDSSPGSNLEIGRDSFTHD